MHVIRFAYQALARAHAPRLAAPIASDHALHEAQLERALRLARRVLQTAGGMIAEALVLIDGTLREKRP